MTYTNLKFPNNSLFLVTGGAGFIGSNLCEALLGLGYRVRCLDDLSNGFFSNIAPFMKDPNFEYIKGTITDVSTCMAACHQVDYVLHQAAWGSVPRSIELPLVYQEINIQGTLNMMDAAVKQGAKKFVYASSSSVYGDSEILPKKEGQEGNVLSPYALTKKMNEEYGKLYTRLYGLETVGLRYFNVFGKRQNPNGAYAAVIPKFIQLFLEDMSPLIYGDGHQSRDFTYIENIIEANLKAASSSAKTAGKVYNIAAGGQLTLNELCKKLALLLDKEEIHPQYAAARLGDIKHSNASIQQAKKDLDYHGSYSFDQGIELAIQWYIKNGKNSAVKSLSQDFMSGGIRG